MELLRKDFSCAGTPRLDIDQFPGNITLTKGPAGKVSVLIRGPQKYQKDVSADAKGDDIAVRGPANYSAVSISGGGITVTQNVTTVRGNMTGVVISGGNVYIGGKKVDPSTPSEDPITCEITLPEGCDLEIGSVGGLDAPLAVNRVRLSSAGQARLSLAEASEVKGSISGQSNFNLKKLNGGALNLTISGQCEAEVGGEFDSIDITVSGQCEVTTRGQVKGDYYVSALGMCDVKHRGIVKGKVSKRSSGMCDISVK
jgi:hypothetical protein